MMDKHFIDTSILLGVLSSDRGKNEARITSKYILRIGKIYEVYYSHLVLGEALFVLKRELREDKIDRNKFIEKTQELKKILDDANIIVPDLDNYISTIESIKGLAERTSETDVRIASEAADSPAEYLIVYAPEFSKKDTEEEEIEIIDLSKKRHRKELFY